MAQSAARNASALSRRAWPSSVQPGVEAFGYHHRSSQWPAKSASATCLPSWSGRENSGAGPPGAGTWES
jgi:hypothetical protein